MEIFYIIIVVVVTEPHMFLRTYLIAHLKLMNYVLCKL